MKAITEVLSNWASGVITTLQAHTLPPTASPRARNTTLIGADAGSAVFAKRRGLRMVNTTPISGSPEVLAQIDFKRASGTTLTPYHLVVSNAGRLDKKQSDDSLTAADAVTAAPFTSGDHRPDWAIAKNLLFLVNGQDRKKFDGTTVYGFGMTALAAPTATDSGVAGTPDGTYEIVVAPYNSATAAYGSASEADEVTVVTNQIDVSWVASVDPQVTHVAVGIRNTANQPRFYEVTRVAIGTTTYRIDVDTALLTTLFPDQDENDPPPSGLTNIEWHTNQRMFGTDGTDLYYTLRDKPESWDPENVETVNRNDGQLMTALHSAHGVLMIFKRHSTYILVGDEPEDWRIEQLDAVHGATSHLAVVTVDGVTYWWSEQGAMAWPGYGKAIPIGTPKIAATIGSDQLNFDEFDRVVAAQDYREKKLLFAVPEVGQVRNTKILPFDYRIGEWVSDHWDPMDAACLASIEEDDAPELFLGGYKGQLFKFDTGVGNDGLPSGSTKSGSVTSATSTTLTDSSASFTTTGGALIERYVIAVDPNETRVQKRRISGNTGTQLTITPAWSTTPTDDWTYVIGGPDFQLDTRWNFGDLPFVKKRLMHFFLLGGSRNSGVSVTIQLFLDFNLAANNPDKSLTATLTGGGAQWDSAQWGSSQWGGRTRSTPARKRVGKTGFAWRARILNRNPDQDVQLFMVGMESELLSSKLS